MFQTKVLSMFTYSSTSCFAFVPLCPYLWNGLLGGVVLESGSYLDRSHQATTVPLEEVYGGWGESGEEKEEENRGEGLGVLCLLFGPWRNHSHHRAQVRHTCEAHPGSVWQLPWQQTHEGPCCIWVIPSMDLETDCKQLLIPTGDICKNTCCGSSHIVWVGWSRLNFIAINVVLKAPLQLI